MKKNARDRTAVSTSESTQTQERFAAIVEALAAGQRFDPGDGRLMKEWLALQPTSKENWLSLAREAMRFVGRNQA
jgi:hypothetical protein